MTFSCSLKFAHAWKATKGEIDTLLDRMMASFDESSVLALTMSGDIELGELEVTFELPEGWKSEDALSGLAVVVRALNSGRVSAPGWPTDEVVDEAIASVVVREFALA